MSTKTKVEEFKQELHAQFYNADSYEIRSLFSVLEAALAEEFERGVRVGAKATHEQAHMLGEGAGFARGRDFGLKEGLRLVSQHAKCREDHELVESLRHGFTYGGPIMDLSKGSSK